MKTKELIDLSPEILISRLREYITKYKLRQIDIANILGVTPGTLSRYLNNKRYPSRKQAKRINQIINELKEIEDGSIHS
jgi:transcriptional regulator with XRE-family HTH domain